MEKFIIDFIHEGIPYEGSVVSENKNGTLYYTVQLESEKPETYNEIIASPPVADRNYWVFKSPDDQASPGNYDKTLLQEIGQAIEKHEASG